jgi:hypothetical protein
MNRLANDIPPEAIDLYFMRFMQFVQTAFCVVNGFPFGLVADECRFEQRW